MTYINIITGGFDQIGSNTVRFIHEASKSGQLHVMLFDDPLIQTLSGAKPVFPLAERMYFIENIRYVDGVHIISRLDQLEEIQSLIGCHPDSWISLSSDQLPKYKHYAKKNGINHHIIQDDFLSGYPEHDYDLSSSGNRKVFVTGCFDWFHTGHIRFFEEAAGYGDLYVIIGHDKNLEKLKGSGHPMFPENERKYMAGSIRFIKQALISTGHGWMDAEPEIERIKPDVYVVNEDGDKDIKRRYCESHGLDYIVLKRTPKPGLQKRTSTDLRGF